MEAKEKLKGYKVFNPDWTCRGFQFEVGKVFEEDVEPSCCNRGFHFCTKASDCFNYYSFDSNNKVAEVEACGEVDTNNEDSKCCTNKIKIIREVSWQELLTIVNTGKDCTGLCNSGNWNSGDCNSGNCNSGDWNSGNWNSGNWNSGDWNSGNWNSGDCNSGDWNSGNWNSGDCNSGNCNSGDCNSGDWNSGNCNSGDWNKSNYNTGCFNTEEQKIMLFNKPSDMTYREWLKSDARHILNRIPRNVIEWIDKDNMTDEEKSKNPTYHTTGGYLKVLDEFDSAQVYWDSLSDDDKNVVMALPNFDAEIFFQCTGIRVDVDD